MSLKALLAEQNRRLAVRSDHMEGSVYVANQLVTNKATVIELEITIPGRPGKGKITLPLFVGTSTRHPDDPFDAQIGYELALGRALRAAGRALIHDGNDKSRKAGRGRRDQQARKAVVHLAEGQAPPLSPDQVMVALLKRGQIVKKSSKPKAKGKKK